uniref:PiggyBac transposable element-derived protein domain-containing protein n=1 Tax=Amphimedon queenslandica TaxID=400682 RepID=A0A1X7U732_AMPQE
SHTESCIDEAIVPYEGRWSLKQYMLKKPVRRGLHVWVRADSLTGYVSQFQVYFGKEVSSET